MPSPRLRLVSADVVTRCFTPIGPGFRHTRSWLVRGRNPYLGLERSKQRVSSFLPVFPPGLLAGVMRAAAAVTELPLRAAAFGTELLYCGCRCSWGGSPG